MPANPDARSRHADEHTTGLVIGHTTHSSTTIWVRGDERLRRVRITLTGLGEPGRSRSVALGPDRDFTAVASFVGLSQSTHYLVLALFSTGESWADGETVERHGSLCTFPDPTDCSQFCFLLGSCNLPTARITSLRELGAGFLGTSAVRRSFERPVGGWYWPGMRCLRSVLQEVVPAAAGLVLASVTKATRFQLPEPDIRSPFSELCKLLSEEANRPAFMIHAGDQIYFDIDVPARAATTEEYRRAYRQAWFEDEDTREVLANLPHYMILDDHEIIDNFDNDRRYPAPPPDPDPKALVDATVYLKPAVEAYRQYVNRRQPGGGVPDGPLHYQFQHGRAFFFVLDTRTQRHTDAQQMIDSRQKELLLAWLREHKTDLTFVVSSVPFVAQLRDDEPERQDKWCADAFRAQRAEIIETIYEEGIERVVFLVGDMHCAYHAMMRVGPPARRVVIHELAGGPINQVDFPTRGQFRDQYRGFTGGKVPFTTVLRSFQTATSSVTRVSLDFQEPPTLRWEIVRTDRRTTDGEEPGPLSGWISFAEETA